MTFEAHILLKAFLAAVGELHYYPESGDTPENLEDDFQRWYRVREQTASGERFYKTLLGVAKTWARDRWYEAPGNHGGLWDEDVLLAAGQDPFILTGRERELIEEARAAGRRLER